MPTDPKTPGVVSAASTTSSETDLPAVAGENPDFTYGPLARRDFLRAASASAGAFLVGGAGLGKPKVAAAPRVPFVRSGESPDIVVVGAGAWGGWTAFNLRQMGAKVTIVDAYGPGNARSTSGDETRGVRSSYGDRPGELGEVWMLWAREAMKKWIAFDDEWGRDLRLNLFHVTGDLIMRTEWDNFQLRCKVWWDKNKIPYQVLNPDDVRKSFPVISMDDITAVLYEPDAGVVRARRACQAVAAAFEHIGGKIVIGRASPGKAVNGRLTELELDTGATVRADTFVYAVGPWLGKTFPELFAKKTRVPMGYVCYFATPIGDYRFTYPNLPSYNFPGVTGWAALPVDNRGFRVRGGERAPDQVVAAADGRGGNGAPANGANANGASGAIAASGAAAVPQGTQPAGGAPNASGRAGGAAAAGRGGRGGQGRGGEVASEADRMCRPSNRIPIRATGGRTRRRSPALAVSWRTVFQLSRTLRSPKPTRATTSRRRAATSSSTITRRGTMCGSPRAETPRGSRWAPRSATTCPSACWDTRIRRTSCSRFLKRTTSRRPRLPIARRRRVRMARLRRHRQNRRRCVSAASSRLLVQRLRPLSDAPFAPAPTAAS